MSYYQRGDDGYPIGSDKIMRDFYGKIPESNEFFTGYRFEIPKEVIGWEWRPDFNRWGALVVFNDGKRIFTSPKEY